MPAAKGSVSDFNSVSGNMGSAIRGAVITPNDSVDATDAIFGYYWRAIWVGGVGNLNVMWDDGTQTLISAIPVGTLLPIQPKRIMAASTTATLIVGLW